MTGSEKTSIWSTGIAAGTGAGSGVAAIATILDWCTNPAGIFHGSNGTDWLIVAETALSWFVPVFVIATFVTVLILFLIKR